MHETTPLPAAPSGVPLPDTGLLLTLPPSSAGSLTLGWLGHLARSCFAGPRYLIRHPARCLAILVMVVLIGAGAAIAVFYLWASYHLRIARAALKRYHTREAVPHLRAALSIRPRDPEALLLTARAAQRANSLEAADRLLDQYQEVRGPEDESLILERVLVRVERGELDSVLNFCLARIERDDAGTPLILEAMSRGYLRMYRPREAERTLTEWLQRQPDNPQALLIQGQVYDLETRQHDSIASFRRALTADPEMDDARLRLCEALMQLGLTGEAQPHLEYLSRRLPDNLMVQVHLARVQDRMGHTEKAEALVDAVLARQPRFPPALAERGKLALRTARPRRPRCGCVRPSPWNRAIASPITSSPSVWRRTVSLRRRKRNRPTSNRSRRTSSASSRSPPCRWSRVPMTRICTTRPAR